jgi:hypothetical protein
MQLVQNNNFVFATLFVYGSDGKPTWYTAALNNAGGFTWTGPLYANVGPWFAALPFNPNAVGARQVGTMVFSASDVANGTITYTVDGISVSKRVTRETLVNENISGNYQLIITKDQVCIPAVGGTAHGVEQANFALSHFGNAFTGQSGGCAFNGTYGQTGKMGNAIGTYSCTSGEIGSFHLFEIIVTETGIMARLSEQSNLCSSISAEAAGIRQ